MKMKTIMIISSLFLAVALTGCGNRIKNEKQLSKDISENSNFHMVEGSEISDLTVIKRLTDETNKTDKVYVSVNVEHEAASKTCAYIMNYTCYNEGWMLDSIEAYYGEEAVWEVVPKELPTNEKIKTELISYSDAKIEENNAEPESYFFEEGKYNTKIYPGCSTSNLSYSCVAETERVFDYVVVRETELLLFFFDEYTYEWKISSGEVIYSFADWYIDGKWKDFDFDVTHEGAGSGYEAFYYGNETKFTGELENPSFLNISPSYTRIENFGGNARVEISPDSIYFWNYNNGHTLSPKSLEQTPSPLEKTGIVFVSVNENAKRYQEVANEAIDAMFNADFSKLKQLWHPKTEYYLEQFETEETPEEFPMHIIPYEIVVEEVDEDDEEIKSFGKKIKEGAKCSYIVKDIYEEEVEYYEITFLMIEQEGKVYIISVDGVSL